MLMLFGSVWLVGVKGSGLLGRGRMGGGCCVKMVRFGVKGGFNLRCGLGGEMRRW